MLWTVDLFLVGVSLFALCHETWSLTMKNANKYKSHKISYSAMVGEVEM